MAAKGLPDYVPAAVVRAGLDKAARGYHMTVIGDIHSHPRDLLERIFGSAQLGDRGRFSAGDLYRMATLNSPIQMMAVVDGDDNVFAFRTKETKGAGLSSQISTQDGFEKYWYERHGFRYLGPPERFGSNRVIPVSSGANGWNVNLAIAERHKLAIYRGYAGGNLVREFPILQRAK